MPFVVVTFWLLNFGSVHGPIEEANPSQKSSIFGTMASNEDILHGLLQNELFLFHHLHVTIEGCKFPFIWLNSHERRFLNISLAT